MQNHFNYIIAGCGAAGLSLAMHMLEAQLLEGNTLLLIDNNRKEQNDRTWCFWEKNPGLFESVVCKQWNHLETFSIDLYRTENINPYRYKMIRGIDFYTYCKSKLSAHKNVQWVTANIQCIFNSNNLGYVVAGKQEYSASYVFSSILLEPPKISLQQTYLLQHFKGYVLETDAAIFDPDRATFMDFRVAQKYGTTFVYVLPLTTTRALVEYTLFSATTLTETQYKAELDEYIQTFLQVKQYRIIEEEFGIIPMTDYPFKVLEQQICYIGTAGGNTRASSGFTFQFIQKQAKKITAALQKNQMNKLQPVISSRAKFLDRVLLKVLDKNYVSGRTVFSGIFKKRKIKSVLRFMDDEASLFQDMQIALTQPKWPFLKALLFKGK